MLTFCPLSYSIVLKWPKRQTKTLLQAKLMLSLQCKLVSLVSKQHFCSFHCMVWNGSYVLKSMAHKQGCFQKLIHNSRSCTKFQTSSSTNYNISYNFETDHSHWWQYFDTTTFRKNGSKSTIMTCCQNDMLNQELQHRLRLWDRPEWQMHWTNPRWHAYADQGTLLKRFYPSDLVASDRSNPPAGAAKISSIISHSSNAWCR